MNYDEYRSRLRIIFIDFKNNWYKPLHKKKRQGYLLGIKHRIRRVTDCHARSLGILVPKKDLYTNAKELEKHHLFKTGDILGPWKLNNTKFDDNLIKESYDKCRIIMLTPENHARLHSKPDSKIYKQNPMGFIIENYGEVVNFDLKFKKFSPKKVLPGNWVPTPIPYWEQPKPWEIY